MSANGDAATPLVLVHGAWLTSSSWTNISSYFGNAGYAVSAPEWPRKHGDVAELREVSATDELAGLGVKEIVDHYAELIEAMDEPPVLVGHSFGGLFVELLLDRGLGRAGVALSPAPPKGILVLPLAALKAASPALAHPSRWHGVVPLTVEEFTAAFANTFTPEDAAAAYERYYVPETGQIFYESGFANFHLHPPTEIHFKKDDRAPLLIIGCSEDKTVPASLAKAAHDKYKHSSARTDYVELEGQPHLSYTNDGWQEVAASIETWLSSVLAV